jgi:hypothetical protein
VTVSAAATPNVGDKVVYVGDRNAGLWPERRTKPGMVVETGTDPDGAARLLVWSPAESDSWGTDATRVRVVERATYIPVDGAS